MVESSLDITYTYPVQAALCGLSSLLAPIAILPYKYSLFYPDQRYIPTSLTDKPLGCGSIDYIRMMQLLLNGNSYYKFTSDGRKT